ncbi:MAG: PIN domain-containing protein [Sulfolobaceae archaeon]
MAKKSLEASELIVDTSFLLPYLGIKVKEISDLNLDDKKLYYPALMLTELFAVVIKEAKKVGLEDLPKEAIDGFLYINYGINLIQPSEYDLSLAYKIIKKGWSDIFDAILYSTHVRTQLPVITLDRKFIEFLIKYNFDVKNIILM